MMRLEVLFLILTCQFVLSIQECPECACCNGGESACDTRKNCTNGCIAGYYGDKCIEECPENCTLCNDGHTCSECKKGYYTSQCNVPCGKGCLNNTCVINGSCPCKSSNFIKDKCRHCLVDKFGDECNSTCPSNCGTCSLDTGCTWCKNSLYYGSYCQYRCSIGCDPGKCHKATGQCITGCKPGYTGDRCDTCSPGFYGEYCDLNCAENCSSCLLTTTCTECKEGLYGKTCSLSCPSGCKENCSFSDGRCLGCKPGFYGEFCNTCIDGRYGYNCSKVCSDSDINCRACFSNEGQYGGCTQCNSGYYPVIPFKEYHNTCKSCPITCKDNKCATSGLCLSGCIDGFFGSGCENNCSSKCATCNQETVDCLHGCKDAVEGMECVQETATEQKGHTTDTLVGATLGACLIGIALGIAIMLTLIIMRKRNRNNEQTAIGNENMSAPNEDTTNDNANQSDSSITYEILRSRDERVYSQITSSQRADQSVTPTT